ncbi:MAG: PASTA domain-containing protein [Clostridiales bacterium]|nr:PASTA domain-containing protein [Clostridiales bacterium]
MARNKTYNKRNVLIVFLCVVIAASLLAGRLTYLMIFRSKDYAARAEDLHERERPIKAARGLIYDRNGQIIATNKPVSTISVIHAQVTEPEKVIEVLSSKLGLSTDYVRKRVEKNSSLERIKSNVEKEIADEIRNMKLDGVMVDEDYKRYYPYGDLASKVIGFTGADNQGIVGLEVEYEKYLKGIDGTILTLTTAYGVEIKNAAEERIEPKPGNNLKISLDVNMQKYAEQAAKKVLEAKEANNVKIILMSPQNGEIFAMVNVPEFDLNEPFNLIESMTRDIETSVLSDKEKQDLLNQMWRNASLSDTYEPGSSFKIVTAAAAIEEGVVDLDDQFFCPGYKIVEDRRIRCHKVGGHGSQTFYDGILNSCNPVFMEVGARLGIDNLYKYFRQLGLFNKTGVDLPGEASSIMHKKENVEAVELATISFGQSFQITPLQLLVAASAVVNGGKIVTPHLGMEVTNSEGNTIKKLEYPEKTNVISKETSETMKMLLEAVVSDGTGKRAYLPGFRVGGKTATSEKLPRSENKYISSFIGFAPADNPQLIGLVLIDEPVGIYYGGTIAAPVIGEVFDNVLPYMGVEASYTEEEKEEYDLGTIVVPNLLNKDKNEVKKLLNDLGYMGEIYYLGEGEIVVEQFPLMGEKIDKTSDLILYLQ